MSRDTEREYQEFKNCVYHMEYFSPSCDRCRACRNLFKNLEGWMYARTIFAEPMLSYLHASMKDKRCALDYQPNKV